MEKELTLSDDISQVERHLRELFPLQVAVCIADTHDIVLGTLGDEIAALHRTPEPDCRTAFEYLARLEWAPGSDGAWRLMYVLYRRVCDFGSAGSNPVEEIERRPMLDMPTDVQRHAHRYVPQLVVAAGGEWRLLRDVMLTKLRGRETPQATGR